jgi:4-aminobutyrate aminotransferase
VMDWPSGSHASTFGGNPVACAAALATIKLLETRYRANALERGQQLCSGLAEIARRFTSIREVRGLGLMIGAEIQSERGEPDAGLRDLIVDLAFQHGLLLLPCGPSTVRFCPPLCVNRRQIEIGLELFSATLDAVLGESKRVEVDGTESTPEFEELAREPA